MVYLQCSGNVQVSNQDVPSCPDGWVELTSQAVVADLSVNGSTIDTADFQLLFGGAVLLLVIGYGIRQVRRIIEERPGRG